MALRCPVCEHQFVLKAQEVCADCRPWACESCGKTSSMAYKKTKSPLEVAQEVSTLMGYGVSIGKCTYCNMIKAVGDMAICRDCCLSKVEETELVCYDCLHEDGSRWTPESGYEGDCRECGESKLLNEEQLCKSCTDKQHQKLFSGQGEYLQTKQCWECQALFMAAAPEQHFCTNHLGRCYGCGGRFSPKSRTEIFCSVCYDNMMEGRCTSCYNYSKQADERGHCYNCATAAEKNFCVVCETTEVDNYGEACGYCKTHLKKCPRCTTNYIYSVEYICKDCKKNE